MVTDSVLRDHGPPVCDIRVVAKCQDSGSRDLLREECRGPWSIGAWGRPGPVAVSREAVDEDDAGGWCVSEVCFRNTGDGSHSTVALVGSRRSLMPLGKVLMVP